MNPKYPNITVDLSGVDGNAFSVMGAVTRELRNNKIPAAEINQFREECMSGDYNNLLQTCFKWVNIDFEDNTAEEDNDDDDYYYEENDWEDDEDENDD